VYDFQSLIFRSASHWSAATALAVLAIGLFYTLQGFRFARFLVVVSCTGGGVVVGGILVAVAGLPLPVAFGVAASLGLLALLRFQIGLALASALTGGALAQYLAAQLGLEPTITLVAAGIGLPVGYSLTWVYRRTLPILVTIVQGAGLLIVGFVGVTNAVAPSLGATFVEWAASIPLMVPGFVLMLCVLGYSVQANAQQGDVETGGGSGLNDLERPQRLTRRGGVSHLGRGPH
jgi:hypothetical protein